MSYTYKYPHPAVATDCVVFGFDGQGLEILLIQRGIEPFKERWAFPGGFMRIDETAEECARRELQEETGLSGHVLKQLGAYSDVLRDPRERVVSIAFYALVKPSEVIGGDDANKADWFPIDEAPPLAFDHDYILRKAMQQLRKDIYFEPIGFELLDEAFTMSELQKLYEAILGVRFDRRNFEKKMIQTGILHPADEADSDIKGGVDNIMSKPTEFYGKKHEMKRKDIDALFPCESGYVMEDQVFCSLSMSDSSVDEAYVPTAPRRRPGRKGRKFSFDKDKYDQFKQDNNFRFEF